MKRTLCLVLFGLMVSTGYAQQGKHGLSHQAAAAQPTTAPTAPSPTAPSESSPDPSGPSRDDSFSSGVRALPGAAAGSEGVSGDPALQAQIQNALTRDPIFSNSHLKVVVLADSIELSGDVANGRDRQNAARMVQSYARGKKVINHIVVRAQAEPPDANSAEKPRAQYNTPSGNPVAGQSSPP